MLSVPSVTFSFSSPCSLTPTDSSVRNPPGGLLATHPCWAASRDRAGRRRMQILSRCARPRMCDWRSLYAHTWSAGLAPDRRVVASDGVSRSTAAGADARVSKRQTIWPWLWFHGSVSGLWRRLRLCNLARIFASLRSEAQQPSQEKDPPATRCRGVLRSLFQPPVTHTTHACAPLSLSTSLSTCCCCRCFLRCRVLPSHSPVLLETPLAAHANCTIPFHPIGREPTAAARQKGIRCISAYSAQYWLAAASSRQDKWLGRFVPWPG